MERGAGGVAGNGGSNELSIRLAIIIRALMAVMLMAVMAEMQGGNACNKRDVRK